MRAVLGAGALVAALAGPAWAGPAWAGGVTVQDGWMRMLIPSRPAAGYFVLHNDTDGPVQLVGAASPACAHLMLHRSVNESGQERMMMVEHVDVPAHGAVTFAPGGYHLMCMQPSMQPGERVNVTLRLAGGATVAASFAVKGATGE